MIHVISFLIISIFVTSAYAESGAAVVVCLNGGKTQVELLDLYEAKAKGLTIRKESDVLKIDTKIFKSEYASYDVKRILESFRPIPADSEIVLINDNYPIFIPAHCELKQLTKYQNPTTTWIDKSLYDQLDQTNKIALGFHTFIYRKEGEFGPTDARYTRTIVGLAFSTKDPFEDEDKIMGDYQYTFCMTEDWRTKIKVKLINKSKNIWRFYFVELNGHRIFSATTVDLAVIPDLSTESILKNPPGFNLVSVGTTKSKINPGESVTIESTNNRLWLSWKGTYPTDEFTKVELRCGDQDIQEWY